MTFMTRAVRQFTVANQSQLESFGMDRFSALGDQAAVFRANFDSLGGNGRAAALSLYSPLLQDGTSLSGDRLADGSPIGQIPVDPGVIQVASSLLVGQAAIISYETDTSAGGSPDGLRFVLLSSIGSGTVIYITDRLWNGTAFAAASAGEGTYVYTAGADLPAGTIITLSAAQLASGGITLSNAGETLYMYQGGVDAPTRFLFAADIADGNGTFNGSLTNTGLTNGTNAVAVQFDNAVYAGSPTQIPATQLIDISTASRWHGTDTDDIGGTTFYTEVHDTTNTNAFTNADMVMIAGMAGGGQSDAILRIGNDEGANVGSGLTRLFQDNPAFNHISDVAFDIENGFFFFVDSDGNNINRIMRGNIADIVNSNSSPTFTQLFATDGQNNGAGPVLPGEIIPGMEVNTVTNKIYWLDGNFAGDFEGGFEVRSMNYDGTGVTLITVLDNENGMGSPFGISGVADYAVRNSTNTMYVVSSLGSVDGLGNVSVLQNHILSINLSTGAVTILALDLADPRSNTGGGLYNEGRLNPNEGQIIGIDVDQNTGIIYFVTQPISASDSGGIFSYNPATDDLQELWNQPSNNAHNTLQTFPTNPMTHIEVDEIGGRIYVSDISDSDSENDATPGINEDDTSIFSLAIGAALGTAPTLFQRVYEPTANGSPLGMEIDYAPITAVTAANTTYTESTNAPASPAGPTIGIITGATVTDPDNTVLQGATVAITNGFFPGDTLSFTNSGGITGSYNAANGVVTFTGAATLAQYQTVLASVRFTNAGDNPTNYGNSQSRTISFTTFDGLANSDPATATITVVGINDAPVNTVPGAQAASEDTGKIITGISVADPDADPLNQDIRVTLSVTHGTLTLLTNVAGGITAGDITGGANGSSTVTITATQSQINATIAANGLTYLNTQDFNGVDTLTIVTNDLGLNGNDPGLTGTGTSEQDSDNVTINIAAVNDAPTVIDATQTAATILEDTPSAGGETVSSLFTASFSDALDQQQTGGNPTGSVANTLAGIAVVGGSTSASGSWQYFNGAIWVNIGAATTAAAVLISAGTPIRFNPALNFNGSPPDLIVHLVDSSGAAITNGATVNLTGATGGTTRYSSATVALSETVTAVNDAPVNTVGGTLTVAEDSGATNVTGMSISDVDANPSTDVFTVTLDVLHGTLNLSTVVAGGVTAGNVTGNGTATVNVTGTINQINATLAAAGGLTYTPTGNYNGSDRVQITTDDGGATGLDPGTTGTATSEADIDSKTISVTAVNDPVTGTAPASLSVAEDATSVAVAGLSISDLDATLAPAGVYDVTLSATNGTMTLTTLAGLTFTVGDGTSDATMTFHGTLAAINTALATATYTPTANYNGAATITLSVTDTFGGIVATGTGAATNDSDVVNVTVTAVNDPVGTAAPPTLTLNEDATNVAVTGLSISDIDTTLAPAGVYDVTLSATNGTLTLTTLAGLTFTVGDGTADATMTFHGTLAAINTALATATYTPTANFNGAATITLSATDTFGGIVATGTGAATSDSDIINVTVTAQNDTPVVSVVASVGSIEQVAGTIDATATIADLELGALNNYAGSSLTVGRNGGPAAQDLLTFGASGAFTVNGANLEAGGLVFATFTGGNGSNLVITFTGSGTPATQALVNAVVQSLQYTYTGDTPPASIVMNYSFDDGAPGNAGQGGGGSPIGTDAITINITDTPENAPPVVDLNTGTGGINDTNVYAEGGAASGIGAAISVSDADVGDNIESATITITDASPGDLLFANLPLPGGITVDPSSTATTLILVGSASAAAYATALGQIGYSSSSDDPTVGGANPDRIITVTVNDGTDNSAPATMTMTVIGVNDEPTLVATGATPTLTEGGAAVDLFSAVSASTVEAGQTITSLTLTVTNVTDGAAETLTFDGSTVALTNGNAVTTATNGLNVTVTVVGTTATVTFSGAALSAAALQTLVDGLAYGNSSQNPTDADRVVTITQIVDSGSNVSPNDNTAALAIAATVNVDPVNDAPVNSVPGAQVVNEDGSFTLSTGNGNAISVADVDATTLTVTLTVTNGTLTLASTAGLSFGTGDGTADLTMTFSGTAAAINAALGSGLTYNPTANYNGPDSIQVVTSDNGQTGTGGTQTDTDSVAITVNSVNDAPAGTDNAVTINEDGSYTLHAADFGFSDAIDGNGFAGVVITTLPTSGILVFDSDGPGGLPGVLASAGQFVTAAQLALGALTFFPGGNNNGTPFATFTFQVRDDGGLLNGGQNTDQSANTFTFNVTAVNDAPVNTVPGSQTINEDGSFTLSTGNGNAISVADVDATTLTVTLTVVNGTLTLASTAGLSFGTGDGTADLTMTFSGTAAAINAALGSGLTYNPTANYNGPDAIQIVTTDNGQTGTGGTQTDSDSVAITINSVNDAPSGADNTVTGSEDDPLVFTLADFGFSDPVEGNAFLAISVITFPAQGKLFLDPDGPGGAAPIDLSTVGSGVFVSAADIALGRLYFQPDADEFGNGYASFTFKVQDDGGITNGGVDLDPTANTMTINVTPDNLAPAVDLDGATGGVNYATTFVEDGAAVAIGSGVVVSDPDSGIGDLIESATITLTDRVAGDSLTLTGALPPGIVAVTTPSAGAITIQITGTGTGAQYQALIESIVYATTSQDPTVGGTDLARTITVTVNDGNIDSAVATTTVNITPIDDAPVAYPDAFTTDEGTPIVAGNLFANNGSGADSDPDGPPLAISAVNGSGANVGVQITLASGALLTVNANGTFNYNPNGVFDPTPTPGSGASNQPAHDSFTYTLAGGNTVTVSLTINGLDTDDLLIGTAGQDVLIAGIGNDTIYALGDNDLIDGGAGIDTAYLGSGPVFSSTVIGWAVVSSEGNDFLTNVEIVIQTGGQRHLLVGSTGFATIQAALNAAQSGDFVRIADGTNNESVTYDDSNLIVIAQPGAVLNTSFSTATAFGITVFGGAGGDHITTGANGDVVLGGLGADVIAGGGGDDVLVGGLGGDSLDGGPGTDAASYQDNFGPVFVNLNTGLGFNNAAQGDTLTGIENLIGSSFADYFIGDGTANRLDGADGDDTLIGGLGADQLIGGLGNDTASYEDNQGAVFASLASGQGFNNAAQGDTYSGIENLTGGAYGDYFIGDGGANILNGADGDDTLIGGLGADQLIGGLGNDTASYEDNQGSVFVNLNTGQGFGNSAQGDTYGGIENVVGSGYSDFLIGDGNANLLDGKGAADILTGGGGGDTFAFTSALGSGNVDTITDFVSGSDKIALDDSVFTTIGGLGALNANAFVVGTAAADANDRIIYDSATGNLYYDADGNGAGAQVLFANLQGHPVLTASDFSVI